MKTVTKYLIKKKILIILKYTPSIVLRLKCIQIVFGIMEGHGNFAFNLIVKLSVELGYIFIKVIIASMSSALSVLLVCNRRTL
jgi:hypothetical protein